MSNSIQFTLHLDKQKKLASRCCLHNVLMIRDGNFVAFDDIVMEFLKRKIRMSKYVSCHVHRVFF